MIKTIFIGVLTIATGAVAIAAPGYCAVLYFGTESITEYGEFGTSVVSQSLGIGILTWVSLFLLYGLGHLVRDTASCSRQR